MTDFKNDLSRTVLKEKLNANTYRNLSEISGISTTTLIHMVHKKGDVRLGAVLAVLESTGYELIIRKKEGTR